MNKIPASQLFALFEGAEHVKIGDIVKGPDINEQTTASRFARHYAKPWP